MKFKIDRDPLLKAVGLVHSVVNPRNTLPILSNILLEADDESRIRFVGTDLEVSISTTALAEGVEKGEVTVPAKKFFDILRELPMGEVGITVAKNNAVTISSNKVQFKLIGLPKDDFPKFPDFASAQQTEVDQPLFKECLHLTSFAISSDEMRYVLNGVLIALHSGKLRLVSTDGRRLAFIEKPTDTPANFSLEAIIPTKTVNELERLLAGEGKVKILQLKNQIAFEVGPTVLVSRLIEGHFPNYEQVIPKEEKTSAALNREAFLAALRRAALLTSPESQSAKLDFVKNKVVVSSRSPNLGEAREELEAETKGPELVIGFNPNYLIDVLRNLSSEEIVLSLTDPDRPGVLKEEKAGYVYVIMPMQLG